MSNIDKQALTAESARESGNILLIVAARMARRELFTPLHYVSELPQKVVSMRVFREALERSEETLQREVCKIVDGHDLMQKKLKEVEAKLEAAEKRIAEQQRSLDHREFLLLSADQVQREYAEALGCAGDNESIMEAIDDMKKRRAELETRTVKLPEALVPAIHNSGEPFMRPEPFGLYLNRDDVLKALRAAGISIKGESNND